jgi:hypothetical protein
MCGVSLLQAQKPEKINIYLNGSVFRDVTDGSGFEHQGYGKCIVMGDFDNDGDLDIYCSVVYSYNKLFQNEGGLRFKEMSREYRVDDPKDTHGVVMADFDNNGYLDIFCANNLEALTKMRGEFDQPNSFYLGFDEGFVESGAAAHLVGGPNYSCGVTTCDVNSDGLLDLYVARGGYRKGFDCMDSFYINSSNGTFTDSAVAMGIVNNGNGYCCSFSDYDNDGDPDLYVGGINDTSEPVTRALYRNNGNGTFTDVTVQTGLSGRGNNISCYWGDFDNDGDQDLFLANSSGPGHPEKEWGANSLFRNNGDGTFTDISKQAGVDILTNSRGSTIGDIDNDGDLDIYVNNSAAESLVLLNDGKGKFTESAALTGGAVFFGHGCALGDIDDDGDLDLFSGNWRRPSWNNPGKWRFFENKTNNKNFLKVNVQGTISNRSAVLSKIYVFDAGKLEDMKALRGFREVVAGSGTVPGNPLQQHFGVPAGRQYDVLVKFPSGRKAVVKNVSSGTTVTVVEQK